MRGGIDSIKPKRRQFWQINLAKCRFDLSKFSFFGASSWSMRRPLPIQKPTFIVNLLFIFAIMCHCLYYCFHIFWWMNSLPHWQQTEGNFDRSNQEKGILICQTGVGREQAWPWTNFGRERTWAQVGLARGDGRFCRKIDNKIGLIF